MKKIKIILISLFVISLLALPLQAIAIEELRETVSTSTVEKGKHGRTRQVYLTKDKVTGKLISRRVEITSYYDTGEIDLLIQKRFKGGELVSERKIKHFRDGRQLKVTEVVPTSMK